MPMNHTLAALSVGRFETAEGCADCGATGWRLRYACPWYMTAPLKLPEPDGAYARAERYWKAQEGKA